MLNYFVDVSGMTSIWRKHLIICLFLGLLAIPIYFMDLASTTEGSGNWITLDFRGLVFWTYITLLAIHVALSSIGVVSFPASGALRIHFWAMVLSVILLATGVVIYGKLVRAQAISGRPVNFNREVAEGVTLFPPQRLVRALGTRNSTCE